jgi:hypothetical protein
MSSEGTRSALAAFRARLAAANSATRCLEAWCAERGLGAGPVLIRRRQPLPDPPDLAALLGPAETVRHRSVTLLSGALALADCDLWWVESRLPPAMAARLAATEQPFGLVVAPLAPRRRLLREGPAPAPHAWEVEALIEAGQAPIAAVRERFRAVLFGGA